MCISYTTSLKAKSLSLGCWSKIESPCLKQIVGVLEADFSEFSIHRRNRSVVSPLWVFLQVGSFLKTRSFSLQESLSSTFFLLLVFHWGPEVSGFMKCQLDPDWLRVCKSGENCNQSRKSYQNFLCWLLMVTLAQLLPAAFGHGQALGSSSQELEFLCNWRFCFLCVFFTLQIWFHCPSKVLEQVWKYCIRSPSYPNYQHTFLRIGISQQDPVAHACNPSTGKTEAGEVS